MFERLAALPGLTYGIERMTIEEVALEYSRVVLQLVPPYASLFLDQEAMLNGDLTEQVELGISSVGFHHQAGVACGASRSSRY